MKKTVFLYSGEGTKSVQSSYNSATDFVGNLQNKLKLVLDADLLFDYPLLDPLVVFLEEQQGQIDGQLNDIKASSREDIAALVAETFYEVTNIREIDPNVELTDQGLDSLSATQMIAQLESKLGVGVDTDILFEYPLFDQMVDEIYSYLHKETV